MSIRPFARGDLDTLEEIELASFPNGWTREVLAFLIRKARHECRVLEQEGQVVGFFLVVHGPEEIHMANLAVHPDFRRRGLGLRALEHIDEMAKERGAERVFLEVRETNLAAQLLYRRAGYRAVGIVPGYYANEDAYRMVKRFGAEG